MGKRKNTKIRRAEDALLRYLVQLDNQVAREMQRTPEERESSGVQKWEPYRKRVERVVGAVVEGFGSAEVGLDSLIISYEAFARALRIVAEELGEDGLGKVRSAYIRETFKAVERDVRLVKEALEGTSEETLN